MLPKGLGGLGGLGNLGNLSGMLKQAMEMKGKIEELKQQLANETVEATAGGGMVQVVVSGRFEIVSLKIDPEVIDKSDPEMLETLVRAAVNEGVRKIQDMVRQKMSEAAGGLDLSSLM